MSTQLSREELDHLLSEQDEKIVSCNPSNQLATVPSVPIDVKKQINNPCRLMSGKTVATSILNQLLQFRNMKFTGSIGLAIVFYQSTNDSVNHSVDSFGTMLATTCEQLAIQVHRSYVSTSEQIKENIQEFNSNSSIHGIWIDDTSFPPDQLDLVCQSALLITPDKDIEAKNIESRKYGLYDCTAKACVELLEYYKISMVDVKVVLLGKFNSHFVHLLGGCLKRHNVSQLATVWCVGKWTQDQIDIVKTGDIVFCCLDRPHVVQKDWLKPGCVVIDCNVSNQTDFDYQQIRQTARFVARYRHSIAPVEFAMYCRNVLLAYVSRSIIYSDPQIDYMKQFRLLYCTSDKSQQIIDKQVINILQCVPGYVNAVLYEHREYSDNLKQIHQHPPIAILIILKRLPKSSMILKALKSNVQVNQAFLDRYVLKHLAHAQLYHFRLWWK